MNKVIKVLAVVGVLFIIMEAYEQGRYSGSKEVLIKMMEKMSDEEFEEVVELIKKARNESKESKKEA